MGWVDFCRICQWLEPLLEQLALAKDHKTLVMPTLDIIPEARLPGEEYTAWHCFVCVIVVFFVNVFFFFCNMNAMNTMTKFPLWVCWDICRWLDLATFFDLTALVRGMLHETFGSSRNAMTHIESMWALWLIFRALHCPFWNGLLGQSLPLPGGSFCCSKVHTFWNLS